MGKNLATAGLEKMFAEIVGKTSSRRGFVAPDGTKIRIYYSPDTADKWTAVLDSPEWNKSARRGFKSMLGMSDHPNHPQGFSQFTEGQEGRHLGKKVPWEDVPENIRKHIISRIS
jgi:hypothetical protein